MDIRHFFRCYIRKIHFGRKLHFVRAVGNSGFIYRIAFDIVCFAKLKTCYCRGVEIFFRDFSSKLCNRVFKCRIRFKCIYKTALAVARNSLRQDFSIQNCCRRSYIRRLQSVECWKSRSVCRFNCKLLVAVIRGHMNVCHTFAAFKKTAVDFYNYALCAARFELTRFLADRFNPVGRK